MFAPIYEIMKLNASQSGLLSIFVILLHLVLHGGVFNEGRKLTRNATFWFCYNSQVFIAHFVWARDVCVCDDAAPGR